MLPTRIQEVWDVVSLLVFVMYESKAFGSVLGAIFKIVIQVHRDIGIQVGDGCGGEVNGQTHSVVTIPVDWQ